MTSSRVMPPRMLAFFGGSPRVVVPDNLKDAVRLASFYEPDINPSYADLARHYDLMVIGSEPGGLAQTLRRSG